MEMLDIVDENGVPKENVVINSMSVEKYQG